MKILLISLCSDRLSEKEFVRPIEQILKYQNISTLIKHYMSFSLEETHLADRIIICGSALKDDAFLENGRFTWLEDNSKPVLGIGSGFLTIARTFGCELTNKIKIGVFKARLIKENRLISKRSFYAYFLTKRAAKISEPLETLAGSGTIESMVKHKSREIYGCLFHPEVMNQEIIVNFALKLN